MAKAVTEARLTAALSEVRQQILDSTNNLVTQCRENANRLHNHQDIIKNLYFKIEKEKFIREYEAMKGEFCIIGYSWKLPDLGRPGTAARRRFLSNLIRIVFVNQELIDQEIADVTPVADLRPIGWLDNNPLIIKFSDLMVANGIKEQLHKIGNSPSAIKVRVMRPVILDALYNDLLRIRRSLLDVNGNRSIYIEEKNHSPFLYLMEKEIIEGVATRQQIDSE